MELIITITFAVSVGVCVVVCRLLCKTYIKKDTLVFGNKKKDAKKIIDNIKL